MSTKIVLSAEALKTLKSFAAINPGMVFKPNHKFEVAQREKAVIGFSDVGVQIPVKFAVQDVPKFLGVLSLHDSSSLELTVVDDKVMKIKSKKGLTNYRFTDPTNVTHIPDNFNLPMNEVGTFSITAGELEEIKKVSNSLALPHVVLSADPTNHLVIDVKNLKEDHTDQHDINSESPATGEFEMVLRSENLAMLIPNDYDVKVSTKFLYFVSKDKKTEYYVAVEPKNT